MKDILNLQNLLWYSLHKLFILIKKNYMCNNYQILTNIVKENYEKFE